MDSELRVINSTRRELQLGLQDTTWNILKLRFKQRRDRLKRRKTRQKKVKFNWIFKLYSKWTEKERERAKRAKEDNKEVEFAIQQSLIVRLQLYVLSFILNSGNNSRCWVWKSHSREFEKGCWSWRRRWRTPKSSSSFNSTKINNSLGSNNYNNNNNLLFETQGSCPAFFHKRF